MKIWQQQKILEIMKSLEKLHISIYNLIKNEQYEEALRFLAECQESAISVGTIIEEIEGYNCSTVFYLEEYCEVIFRISQEMKSTMDSRVALFLLCDNIEKIKKSIMDDIIIKKEMVFFPYKAAMWDSLESIYYAAKENSDYDVYCVPIPYFDKKQDGIFGDMHYEGEEYPADIEIVEWETYFLEKRRPDIVFIHNPYDEFNYVTSVHPRFYASNLRKYTEMLIYVPYFVLEEIDTDNQEKIEGMKHFCYMPGTIYADRVILQSENIRQIYINEYIKIAEEQGFSISRKALEKRFWGIGSPKFDKVSNNIEVEIPNEWKRLVVNQDGSLKKIIFYNTSISGLLLHNEKMIEKMKYVFRVFKEHVEEVVLLWRPHPLIETTISSMRPELWMQYKELLNQYRMEGWGIYDETSDVHRAIDISDAYYGDESSVVQMYQKTGKPIMIQAVMVDDKIY